MRIVIAMLGGIVVTSGRLGDICKVGGSRLVGRLGSTVGSTVGRLDGTVGSMDAGSIVVHVGFGCPSRL